MNYRFWVFNLNTDEGQYADSADNLANLIDELLGSGLILTDIGITLEHAV